MNKMRQPKLTVPAKPVSTEIKRSNSTIGLVIDDRYEYTVNHRKMYAAILLVSQSQPTSTVIRAYLADLMELSGCSIGNISEAKNLLKRIRDTSGWFRWVNDNDEIEHRLIGLIDRPAIHDGRRGKRVIVEWEIDPKIRQDIIDPTNMFTRMYLENITKLRKGHSVALYEIACQFERLNKDTDGWGSTGKKTVAQWASVLIGNQKKEYEFALFNRDILKPAISEINEASNLEVNPIFHKEGKRVVEIEFRIRSKAREEDSSQSGSDHIQIDPRIYQLLGDLPISKTVIANILRNYKDPDYIKKHALQMKSKLDAGTKISNPTGYIVASLKNDYTDSLIQPGKSTEQSLANETTEKISKFKEDQDKARAEKQRDDSIISMVMELDEEERSVIIQKWLSEESSSVIKSTFRNRGLNHFMTSKSFVAWWTRTAA
jgi:plasmid replication initiation protein